MNYTPELLFIGWSETKLMCQSWHLTIQQLNLDKVAVQYPKLDDITDIFGDLSFFTVS